MKKVIIALLLILCAGMGGLLYWISKETDTVAPEIRFPDKVAEYVQGEDTEKLLEGVTAVDDIDGDVSSSLVVESIIPMENKKSATVLYYAKDKSNNIAKASRIISYMPSGGLLWDVSPMPTPELAPEETQEQEELPAESPRITLTTDEATVKWEEGYNLLSYVADITDDVDSFDTLSHYIQIQGKDSITGPGVYELYYMVCDLSGNPSNRAKLVLTVK